MSFPSEPGFPVGTLLQWNPQTKQTSKQFKIYSNEEIYIGRDNKRCQYVIEDPFISNRHLRVYTIIFDQDNPIDIAPLVYIQDISMNGTMWNGYAMGQGSGSFLLSEGDILRLSPNSYLIFQCEIPTEEDDLDMIHQIEMETLERQYVITERKLGSGAYGKVQMVFKKDSGQQLACKIVDIRNLRKDAVREVEERQSSFFKKPAGSTTKPVDAIAVRKKKDYLPGKAQEKLDSYNREAMILEHLCHPNIIGVEKVVKSNNTIYLFQELITAGDLFSFIQYKGGKLGDIEAAVIVRQILLALDYLHERHIVHRDLKPDNILMTSLADGGRVVLTDFGCARLVQPTVERMSTMVGTFEYSAPEVLRSKHRGYTKAVDLWSLGCVTVALLTGDSPFREELSAVNPRESAQKCDLERLEEEMEWNGTGDRARDFVRRLLVLDETKRMNVKQALRHSWFTNPAHKREFEALYSRSIRDWKPRVRTGSLIVDISSFAGPCEDTDASDECQISKQVPLRETSGGRCASTSDTSSRLSREWISHRNCRREAFSSTLSDLALPAYARAQNKITSTEKAPTQPPQHTENSISSTNSTELLSHVQFIPSPDSLMDDLQYTDPLSEEMGDMPAHHQTHQPKVNRLDINQPGPHSENRLEGLNSSHRSNHHYYHPKIRRNIWDDYEDEVYEEVDNMVTGKSQRFRYGVGPSVRMGPGSKFF